MAAPIIHDFRSDTVTRPSPEMLAAMVAAPLGDDVLGDDPTVRRLEDAAAERLGKAAGLFFPSGTQANLTAIMAHCGRGDEYIVGQYAHCYRWEAGGAAVLGSVQPQPLENQPDGTIALSAIADAVKPVDAHFARSRLLALENTFHGKVLPVGYAQRAAALAHERGLATHLDGARLFNAAIASEESVAALATGFDTVSLCLSKGLGAPVGSVLVGSVELLREARAIRKMLGGGMRQAGILAAAGLFALERNVGRLAEDHANARRLAARLQAHRSLSVEDPHSNIVMAHGEKPNLSALGDVLRGRGIGLVSLYGDTCHRWVTHMDVNADAIDAAAKIVDEFYKS